MKIVPIFTALMLCSSPIFAGNVQSSSNDNIEMGLSGTWHFEPVESQEEGTISFAKDYNTCMERADNKNTLDHERCDNTKAGTECHDKADKQYEENRSSCERVSHSDNLKETGQSWSGGTKTQDTVPDHFYKGRD